MHIILTVCSGLILVGTVLAWWRCVTWADAAAAAVRDCEAQALAFRSQTSRVLELERELATLTREVRKLSGKFYAMRREVEEAQEELQLPAPENAPVCENWQRAQDEGPRSAAAKCECDYCDLQRSKRAALRRAQLPKNVAEMHDAAKRGLAQS